MRTSAKNISFIVTTVFLVLCSAFFITKTVQGQAKVDLAAQERYYVTLEQEYVSDVRAYLNEQGFTNSGVALTRVVDAQGTREYQVVLHHRNLEKMSDCELQIVFEEIKGLAFQEEGCSFQINLLG